MFTAESVLRWAKLPRDSETIKRSIARKLIGLDFGSSYPLISGDTFKLRCDYILEGMVSSQNLDFNLVSNLRGRFYVQAKPLSNAIDVIIGACGSGLKAPYAELVIHNGDIIPNEIEMKILSRAFQRVYSVNWLGDPSLALPLPIGLENRYLRRNGVPDDFLKEMGAGLPPFETRPISLLACFSLSTNFDNRSRALKAAEQIPGVKIVSNSITPSQYRKLLLESKYVLSPPGNGPDCHRTWEALYLGATPIVDKIAWPFTKYDIPVRISDSWNDLDRIVNSTMGTVDNSWRELENWLPAK